MQESFHFPHDTNQNFYSFYKKHSVHDFTISPQISPFKCDLLCSQHEVWCPDWGHKGVATVLVTLSGKQKLTLLSKAVFGFSALFAEAARSLLSRRSLMSPWPSALPPRSAHKWDLLCTEPACYGVGKVTLLPSGTFPTDGNCCLEDPVSQIMLLCCRRGKQVYGM